MLRPPFAPDEQLAGDQDAGLINRQGVITKGELVATDRRLLFLTNGWQKIRDYRPQVSLEWDQLDSITAYPVKRSYHIFIRSTSGEEWRFWATDLHPRFTYLAFKAVNLVEVEDRVWRPSR